MFIYSLLYGRGAVHLELGERSPEEIIYKRTALVKSESSIIAQALSEPIGTNRLSVLAEKKQSAVILISDISRLCPSYLFLPALIDELLSGGLTADRITVIVALGLHRKQTVEELKQLVGEEVYTTVRVVNHSSLPEDCVPLGVTSLGTPVEVNRLAAEADLLVATGNIEPHALVGISGGVKALIPGVASKRTIQHNHGMSQQYPAPVLGSSEHPVRLDMEEALRMLPVHFLFNVVVDHERRLIGAFAGDAVQAHRAGVAAAAELFVVDVDRSYDVTVVSTGGYPKDTQLYQSLKALRNASAITKPGGSILFVAECPELYGNGVLQEWLETMPDRERIVAKLHEQFVIGAHKVLHIDEVLQQHRVFLFSSIPDSIVRLIGFEPVTDLQAVYNRLTSSPNSAIAIMPYGSLTFPRQTAQSTKAGSEGAIPSRR
jgi:nickel-dependent lactate racemase